MWVRHRVLEHRQEAAARTSAKASGSGTVAHGAERRSLVTLAADEEEGEEPLSQGTRAVAAAAPAATAMDAPNVGSAPVLTEAARQRWLDFLTAEVPDAQDVNAAAMARKYLISAWAKSEAQAGRMVMGSHWADQWEPRPPADDHVAEPLPSRTVACVAAKAVCVACSAAALRRSGLLTH